MRELTLEKAYANLHEWCRKRNFAGYDPFDALNSRIFQTTPLKHSRMARLVWTQLIKRFPLNLRPLILVQPQTNAKGVALFALAALATYRRLQTVEAETEARELLNELLSLQITGFSGAAWGYNFHWQSRQFYAPRGTPMIVPTAFAARALLEAHEAFGDRQYLETAQSTCNFILKDLKRTVDSDEEVCFSYSPLDQTRVFNASLLAAETLAGVARLTTNDELCGTAIRAARYVVRRQREDGSWVYGDNVGQEWIDSFHTAYVLFSLKRILNSCTTAAPEFSDSLLHGYQYWRKCFFLADGWPKYYHDKLYPADAHAAASAIVTLLELQELDRDAPALAEKIAAWTLRNLPDRSGYFYYQRKRFYTIHTPFMRWTQGWMMYATARLLESKALTEELHE